MSRTAPTRSAGASAAPDAVADPGHPQVPCEDDLALIGRALRDRRHVLLAVSGGADSTALMHLAREWAHLHPASAPRLQVATVDHRLRPQSAAEAASVAKAARALGLDHAVLRWDAPTPASGLQEAAREARRALLFAHARAIGADAVAMAHTADDQAETLIMRLVRGSGLDGLAGMAPVTAVGPDLVLLRPLLAMTRARAEEVLRTRGVDWVRDPSNLDPAFERVRIRSALAGLADLGLTADPLATSARRLLRARQALEAAAVQVLDASHGCVAIDPLGFATIDWRGLCRQPAEVRLRVLADLIETIGGTERVSLATLEALTEGRDWALPAGLTIGRVLFRSGPSESTVLLREPGRLRPPPIRLSGPGRFLFDGRFEVRIERPPPAHCELRILDEDGLAALRAGSIACPPVSRDVLVMLPSLWIAGELAAVPLLGSALVGGAGNMVNVALRRTWQAI